MFRFGAKKPTAPGRPARVAGLDVTASRAAAVAVSDGRARPLPLDAPHDPLPLVVGLGGRSPTLGHAAAAECRRVPHATCGGFLGLLGAPREWRAGRTAVTPESATRLAFERLATALAPEATAVGLALPGYLSAAQARAALALAEQARLPVAASAAAPLAVVAHRAAEVGPGGTVLLLDADDHALSAALVTVASSEVKLVGRAAWPQASARLWADRLIDGIADHCVRVCRRDPRDSADAEQGIFDQLPAALDAARSNRRFALALRGDHWFQDLPLLPGDLEAIARPLVRIAVEGLKQLLLAEALPLPPRAIWLTDAAGRLPGLAATLHRHSPERTEIAFLPPLAAAEAAAALAARHPEGSPVHHADAALTWSRLVSAEPPRSVRPGLPAPRPSAEAVEVP